jgi:hypothetical protein
MLVPLQNLFPQVNRDNLSLRDLEIYALREDESGSEINTTYLFLIPLLSRKKDWIRLRHSSSRMPAVISQRWFKLGN